MEHPHKPFHRVKFQGTIQWHYDHGNGCIGSTLEVHTRVFLKTYNMIHLVATRDTVSYNMLYLVNHPVKDYYVTIYMARKATMVAI